MFNPVEVQDRDERRQRLSNTARIVGATEALQRALDQAFEGPLEDATDAASIQRLLAAVGWTLAPMNPTPAMIDAGADVDGYESKTGTESAPNVYAAMIAATPK